jgi:hypothetical protein
MINPKIQSLSLIIWAVLSPICFGYWEYQGYLGSNNEIDTLGMKKIHKSPYPKDWAGFSEIDEKKCLCDEKTLPELLKIAERVFRDAPLLIKEVKRGSKLTIFSRSKEKKPQVVVYGIYISDSKQRAKAFEKLKQNLPQNDHYAFMHNGQGVYFAERSEEVPPRAFLHFVRGYDLTAAN